jgi:hypothetical protein
MEMPDESQPDMGMLSFEHMKSYERDRHAPMLSDVLQKR